MSRKSSSGSGKSTAVPDKAERLRTILYSAAAVVAALGVGETIYLTAMHLAGAHITCVASGGCSQVLGSKYSAVNGIPVAAFGIAAYFTAFSSATLSAFRYPFAAKVFTGIVLLMFLGTLWLLYLQAFVIHSFCDYCLLSAAMTFALTAIVVLLPPKRTGESA
jgi:uncharacterized membrane protein